MPESAGTYAAFTEVTHSMTRRTIARRLTESKQTIPHFYLRASCRVDALLALRASLNARSEAKVSLNDMIVRALALALKAVPDANVQFGEKAMRRFSTVDVAVAVATPRGLVTPIVRNACSKDMQQIAAEIRELATRARSGKLMPEEYNGGQTTVSNLGMFRAEEFSAILNPPQSSIFAVGAAERRPVVSGGEIAPATVMTVTASFDHRAIDGAVGAQLMDALRVMLEAPGSDLG